MLSRPHEKVPTKAHNDDLGYHEDTYPHPIDTPDPHSLGYNDIDLGYGYSVEDEESRGVDRAFANELARRAIDGGGCIRRGSLGRRESIRRGSLGRRESTSRRRSAVPVGRRESLGQRRGSVGRSGTIENRRRMGRRSTMGADVEQAVRQSTPSLSGDPPTGGTSFQQRIRRRASRCNSIGTGGDQVGAGSRRPGQSTDRTISTGSSSGSHASVGSRRPVQRSGSNSSLGSIESDSSYDSDDSFD